MAAKQESADETRRFFIDASPALLYNRYAAFGRQSRKIIRGAYRLPDYQGKQVMRMTTFEILMVFIGIMNCLLIVLVAFISSKK